MATHNGATTLPRVLQAYTALAVPQGQWKVVIVDNASSDATPAIIDQFARQLPIRYVHEPRRGKNKALNTGLKHVEGDLVVLTDDDAIPDPGWLKQLFDSAQQNHDYAVFGGAIRPKWDRQPAQWIVESVPLGLTFGLTDCQLADGAISPRLVWGANLAVRAGIFEKGFRFNEAIGPGPGRYIMGGETEFILRLHESGFRSWFCPRAVVYHIIRANQLEASWMLERAHRYGRTMHFTQRCARQLSVPRVLGIPRWMVRKYMEEYLRALVGRFRGEQAHAFKAQWQLHYLNGLLHEAFASRRRRGLADYHP
jgi:glycosyltransferase involved in cell wall biosynthesis